MGLEQDFKKETGQDAYHKDQTLWNDYYIEWLESRIEQLTIPVVVGQSGQLKAFADYVQKKVWEDGDKDLSEFVDEFLRL